ncbi:MAG: integrase arm-type DNA-binding domain-containing protein [Candidatus Saccharibacteria bacterium]|nr:integrase arm-type DNA-binding domain-containing protein [Rhodoferax sp.]
MPRIAKEMGPLEIKRLTAPGYFAVGGAAGLTLQITPNGIKSWLLRVKVGTKRREIGLGAYPGVGVALARVKAQELRDAIVAGVDPVAQRAQARQNIIQQQLDAKALDWTFRRCAEAYIKAKAPGWRNAKHAQQWENTLATYVYPSIGEMLVRNIGISHVTAIIEPHWTTKNETINRVRNRIELVLDWATARKYRTGENPARWKGNLDKLLADRSKVAPVTGHRALAAADLYGFVEILRGIQGMGARCLEFVILTASRSGEARLARWAEIDTVAKTWNIPGERMKSGRPHRVPLPDVAMQLLENLPRVDGEALIFPSSRTGKALSDMAMTKVMRDMGVDAVPHGFRATFSSWCASSTAYPTEVREMALAHAIGDGTVAAYQRSDLFDKRRNLMTDWAKFINAEPLTGKVIPIRSAA